MKIEFIKRGAETRLILIFAGWSTDARYYNDCIFEGWDTAIVSDYRDISMPEIPAQYSTVYVFAYSLGVWAAAMCDFPAAARIAICGSEYPVSDEYGIPESVFKATADGLTVESLYKFHRRMAGDRNTLNQILSKLPESPQIESLKEELLAIAHGQKNSLSGYRWDKVYIAKQDRIFPFANLERFWGAVGSGLNKVYLDSSHAVDIAGLVRETIPDSDKIKAGFLKASSSYNENAVVQSEICNRIGETMCTLLNDRKYGIKSLLEIGVGQGLLTQVWSKYLSPSEATFVDLLPMPQFGIAEKEEYIVGDAEVWFRNSKARYDIILSASAIQWFADPVGFVSSVKEHLNPGGLAVISTFVKGNLHQLDSVRPSPIIYHNAADYNVIPGIYIEEWVRTLTFSSSREMLMHLRLTGVSPARKGALTSLSSLPTELTYCPAILIISK